jgi:hypothetical protein
VLASDAKLGLEALSNKYFSFITETYLPKKLREKRWLDLRKRPRSDGATERRSHEGEHVSEVRHAG